jgi:hypothetical protein
MCGSMRKTSPADLDLMAVEMAVEAFADHRRGRLPSLLLTCDRGDLTWRKRLAFDLLSR